VLDADISKCFDNIDHSKLLSKIGTFPTFSRQIKAWLKAGVIDFSQWAERKGYNATKSGTPQGGCISPLLANIALHGMEKLIEEQYPSNGNGQWKGSWKLYQRRFQSPRLIRYADDFVVICEELEVVKECKSLIEKWLSDIGLELKPSKTRIAHTKDKMGEEDSGFQFLGFEIKQFPVGRHKSGKSTNKKTCLFQDHHQTI
jgi:RNA-directed DNA polymerase